MKGEEQLIHDRECTKCKRYWNCKGKVKGTNCVYYEERNDRKNEVWFK